MIKAIQRRKSLCRLIVSFKEIRFHHGEESWVQVAGQVARISREVTFQLQAGSLQERRVGRKVSLYTLNANPKWQTLPSDLRGCTS